MNTPRFPSSPATLNCCFAPSHQSCIHPLFALVKHSREDIRRCHRRAYPPGASQLGKRGTSFLSCFGRGRPGCLVSRCPGWLGGSSIYGAFGQPNLRSFTREKKRTHVAIRVFTYAVRTKVRRERYDVWGRQYLWRLP